MVSREDNLSSKKSIRWEVFIGVMNMCSEPSVTISVSTLNDSKQEEMQAKIK